jgi:hypothetical protein
MKDGRRAASVSSPYICAQGGGSLPTMRKIYPSPVVEQTSTVTARASSHSQDLA